MVRTTYFVNDLFAEENTADPCKFMSKEGEEYSHAIIDACGAKILFGDMRPFERVGKLADGVEAGAYFLCPQEVFLDRNEVEWLIGALRDLLKRQIGTADA